MMTVLLYTVFALIANACFVLIMYISIQPTQWLGAWDKVLSNMDKKGIVWVKPLGYCELCFSHMMTFFLFWVYAFFMTDNGLWHFGVISSIIWFLVYDVIGTILSLYFVTKLFKE